MQQRVEAKRRQRSGGGPPAWLMLLLGLIIGVAGGLGWAWVIQPLEFENATPDDLAQGGKRMWVDMTADSYAHEEDLELAQTRLQFFSEQELAGLFYEGIQQADETGQLPQAQRRRNLASVLNIEPTALPVEEAEETPGPISEDMWGTALMACGGGLAALIIFLGLAVFFTRSRQSRRKPPARKSSTRTPATIGIPTEETLPVPDESPKVVIQEPPKVEPEKRDESLEGIEGIDELLGLDIGQESEGEPDFLDFVEPEAPPVSYSSPLDEFMTRYNYGDDGYDMSYSIETAQTEFLGECGIGMSESLNRGSPQQATAFEVWLFDKDDIRTVTKVLLSEYAWNDEQIRNRLAPKGELVLAKEGESIDLETKSLRVRANIHEIEYGHEGEPNGYFERLVIELVPQQKM